jgi:hypothetical protein
MQITIRGQSHEFNEIADTQIMPLARIFGAKEAPDEGTPAYEKWKIETTNVFMEPPNQAAVAYFLVSILPGIDPAIARYRIKRFDEGYSEIDFYLAINADELLQIIDMITPLLNARAKLLNARTKLLKDKDAKVKAKGFAKPPESTQKSDEPEITEEATEIENLKARLRELESAPA